MPSVVLSSFLQLSYKSNNYLDSVCQCPQSCFLHFYEMDVSMIQTFLRVSMPSVVLSSFLHGKPYIAYKVYRLCQCPQSCFLHFYLRFSFAKKNRNYCVNALSRAFFISTGVIDIHEKQCYKTVSMPSVVLSSFLRQKSWCFVRLNRSCQCPQSCFLHFYGTPPKTQ